MREDVTATGTTSRHLFSLAKSMANHLLQSRSDATVSKYYGAFKRWKTFITAEGGQPLPAEPVHVALYITHLIDTGSSAGTVQAAVYGIKWAHTVRGIVDPTSNHYVKSLLESAKRQNSTPVQKKISSAKSK